MAMAIFIALAVAVTLIPALLAIGGRAIFWPHRPGVELSPTDAAKETPTLETQGSRQPGKDASSRCEPLASVLLPEDVLHLNQESLDLVQLSYCLLALHIRHDSLQNCLGSLFGRRAGDGVYQPRRLRAHLEYCAVCLA
jgi:hypothetical protein